MAEFRPEAEQTADVSGEAESVRLQAPGDAESRGLEQARVGTLQADPGDRDDGALLPDRPAADAESAEFAGNERADHGNTAVAAGRLTLRDLPQQLAPEDAASGVGDQGEPEAAPEKNARDTYLDGAQDRYELGQIPLAASARTRAAAAEQGRAARLHEHHVNLSTAAAMNLMRAPVSEMHDAAPLGLTAAVADRAGVPQDAASAGVAEATALRVNEIQSGGSVTQTAERAADGQRRPGVQDPEATEERSGTNARLNLTMRINDIQYQLSQTERVLAPGERAALQTEHDAGIDRLRDMFRDEMHTEREATSAALQARFQARGEDAHAVAAEFDRISEGYGILYEKLVAHYGENDQRTQDARGEFERAQLAGELIQRYAGGSRNGTLANFPDHAPSESELAALVAGEREHEFVRQYTARGPESWRTRRALDAAYEANQGYKVARQREFAAVDAN